MTTILLADLDDAEFPLESAQIVDGIFLLRGHVDIRKFRFSVALQVSHALSFVSDDEAGTGTLILESAG